jgi:hypothetical protein
MRARLLSAVLILVTGCSSSSSSEEPRGATVRFEAEADFKVDGAFFAFPQPSDLRVDGQGAPDLAGFPNPTKKPTIDLLKDSAAERRGASVLPVAYFQFDRPLAPREPAEVIPAEKTASILLVDVDPNSNERGKLVPTVAATLEPDDYVPEHLLAVAARPGFVLHGDRRYAVVVLRSVKDSDGRMLGVPPALAALTRGETPPGARGPELVSTYASLWETLDALGVARTEVAAATVFTTGDVQRENLDLVTKVRAAHSVAIEGLELDLSDDYPDLCVLKGYVDYPQFQRGTAPFNTEGLFEAGKDGLPVQQRVERAPIMITLPKRPMPTKGYPLELFIHGSGGFSYSQISPLGDDDKPRKGAGPAHVVARHGIAVASSAMPVNPERLPGASPQAYVNANNIPMTRDVFRQGVIESALFLDALKGVSIPPELVQGCAGPTLPMGASAFKFDPDQLLGAGQSMGAWYTNLVAPLEPRMKAIVPTGAGGYLTLFLTTTGPEQTTIGQIAKGIGPILFGVYGGLTFLHPAASLAEIALEPSDPMTGQPRVGLRPLPGMPARSIYTPVGRGDSYFSNATFEAVELAYGVELAGEPAWPELAEALALDGRGKSVPYPVAHNRTSANGEPFTGVVVTYEVEGYDPHAVYSHDDRVRHQFGCFLATHIADGVAKVVAPGALDAPCE